MAVLEWFQGIRTPALDAFFLTVTSLGEETVVLVALLLFYWCLDKKTALRIGLCYFAGGWLSQLLKLTFLVPRPFVLNDRLIPHPDAIEAAAGYSFPSGHTASSVSMAMGLGLTYKKRWLWGTMGLYVLLVGLSRLYLGVHTPQDVIVALLTTVPICLLAEFIMKTMEKPGRAMICWFVGAAASFVLIGLGLVRVWFFDVPEELANTALKTGGAALGFLAALYLDRRFLNFEVKAAFWQQVIKLLVGAGIALGLKSGLKIVLGEGMFMQALRYFIVVLFAAYAYPALFSLVLNGRKKHV